MRAFAQLFVALDRTTRTSEKVTALENYLRETPPEDAAWALWFLSGQRLKRAVKTTHLREWAAEAAGLPLWLVEESYEHVGDLGETLARLLPPNPAPTPLPLVQLVTQRLLPLAGAPEATQRELLRRTWAELDATQCLLWHKLITGNFRVGVSRALLVRALANMAGVAPAVMAHRLMGRWQPTAADFGRLISGVADARDPAQPYPFFLASPLEGEPRELGTACDWQVEWKWDGIRAQLLRRAGEVVLWSRGEEIITPAFPEIAEAARALPDGTVLDGELLAWQGDRPLGFAPLQRRLNRRAVSAALRATIPVVFMAYDVLEANGVDWRSWTLAERRAELQQLVGRALELLERQRLASRESRLVQTDLFFAEAPVSLAPVALRVSPVLAADAWEAVGDWQERARAQGTEGLMLKRRDSAYGVGRQRGAWWKWKVHPFTCDAVLVAAQPGHGRRATLFTDYTFAVWQGQELVPVAKAYSGLSDAEIDAVDAFVRANTTGRFGPVRAVKPELVFELAFEGLAPSTRHKAGIALRFPRMARWRQDKLAAEADTLETLRRLAQGTVAQGT
jgi:DNA ligase-1